MRMLGGILIMTLSDVMRLLLFGLDLASHPIYGYPTHRLGVTSPQHRVEVPARAGDLNERR